MTYQQVLENARTCIGPYCKACNDCNGKVCRNTMPGPGAKGEGLGFIRNAEKWRNIIVCKIVVFVPVVKTHRAHRRGERRNLKRPPKSVNEVSTCEFSQMVSMLTQISRLLFCVADKRTRSSRPLRRSVGRSRRFGRSDDVRTLRRTVVRYVVPSRSLR